MPTFFLLFISFFLLFWQLGDNHLNNWDEAWYADVGRSMAEGGNFLTPTWNGQTFFDKPPLSYWLTALVFRVAGVSEFTGRAVSAFAGLATVVLVYGFVRKRLNSITGAFLSSVILLTMIGFVSRARTGNMDSLLTFFLFLSVYSYYLLKKQRWGWMVFGASLGAAFLTKGFVAFGFPFVVLGWQLFHKKRPSMFVLKGLGVSLVISLVWIISSYMVNGTDFLVGFFQHQGGKVMPNGNPLDTFSLIYLGYLKSGLKYWFLFLPFGLFAWRNWRHNDFFLIILYALLYLGFISFSENKSDWFLMPLYPVIAVFIGYSMTLLPKIWHKTSIVCILLLSLIHVVVFRQALFPPDVAKNEAYLAKIAGSITKPDDVLYMTNYYYPTTIYYSRRRVYSLYADVGGRNGTWWILPKSEWINIVKQRRVFIVTTKEEFSNLGDYLNPDDFVMLASKGDKAFFAKITNL